MKRYRYLHYGAMDDRLRNSLVELGCIITEDVGDLQNFESDLDWQLIKRLLPDKKAEIKLIATIFTKADRDVADYFIVQSLPSYGHPKHKQVQNRFVVENVFSGFCNSCGLPSGLQSGNLQFNRKLKVPKGVAVFRHPVCPNYVLCRNEVKPVLNELLHAKFKPIINQWGEQSNDFSQVILPIIDTSPHLPNEVLPHYNTCNLCHRTIGGHFHAGTFSCYIPKESIPAFYTKRWFSITTPHQYLIIDQATFRNKEVAKLLSIRKKWIDEIIIPVKNLKQ